MTTITHISVPTQNQVDEKSQAIFANLKSKLGMVPNLYAAIGYSSSALENILNFSGAAANGSFTNKEVEAIKLAVSEANNCDYCRAAHTALGKMNGFTEEETLELRKATIQHYKLNVLTTLAKEVAENAGRVTTEAKENFFDLGYGEKELIDFVSIVISVTFTNYVYGLTEVPIDFPEAKTL